MILSIRHWTGKSAAQGSKTACIAAAVLGLAIPMWNFTRQMLALESNIGKLGALVAILVAYGFIGMIPLFSRRPCKS